MLMDAVMDIRIIDVIKAAAQRVSDALLKEKPKVGPPEGSVKGFSR